MLRNDSVVEPASAVVSATICFWIVLMRLLSTELRMPSTGTVRKYTGAISQCTRERVNHHEHDADERREEDVDDADDQLLDVGAHLLKLAECFAAALIFEDRIRQLERVADAVRVELRAQALCDQVDVVVLKILGDARDERHANRGAEQQRHAAEELAGRVLRKPRRVIVDDVSENQRIESENTWLMVASTRANATKPQ